jgi:hypothetical protein
MRNPLRLPLVVSSSNHEQNRSSFDRLRTSVCAKSALQNQNHVGRSFQGRPNAGLKAPRYSFCNARQTY